MMHLVLDPAAQERVYDEVVSKAGKTARITEADVEQMPYLEVIIKSNSSIGSFILTAFDSSTILVQLNPFKKDGSCIVLFWQTRYEIRAFKQTFLSSILNRHLGLQ
jgi:hypothetical protein